MPVDKEYNVVYKDGKGQTRSHRAIEMGGEGFGPDIWHKALTDENGVLIDQTNPLSVGRPIFTVESIFTRADDATAYAANRMVSDSKTTSFVPGVPIILIPGSGRSIEVPAVKLHKSGPLVTNASFRVHLFATPPTTLPIDGAAMTGLTGVASYLGRSGVITLEAMFGDGAVGWGVPEPAGRGAWRTPLVGDAGLYWLLEVTAAYVPLALEVFTLTPEIIRN